MKGRLVGSVAIYSEPYFTGPLTTGGDSYNYFVLRLLPASYNDVPRPPVFTYGTSAVEDAPRNAGFTSNNISDAFLNNLDVVQHGGSGSLAHFVTSYFLNDTETGVLSIPSFHHLDWDIGNFSAAVQDFIHGAQAANLARIIIDLQQNDGGMVELAFVVFGQFFPGKKPFTGSQRRSHKLANARSKLLF